MPRTRARVTEADLNRAAKVAKRHGMDVLVQIDGTIRLTAVERRPDDTAHTIKEREFTLG